MSFQAFESGSSFEREVFANSGQEEKLTQSPAHPEILFHTHRLQTDGFVNLLKSQETAWRGNLEESIHVRRSVRSVDAGDQQSMREHNGDPFECPGNLRR